MKVVQFAHYGDPDVLQVQEVPDLAPGPNDVLIEVKATTVNRLDLFQRNGSRPVDTLPFIPGLEAAGSVLNDAKGFRAGERVLTTRALAARGGGGYASRIAVPASELVRIPEGVTFEQAAAAGLAASTAWGSLFDLGHLQKGERVLIWAGSSGVGSLAIQLAKQAGAWVATTAGSAQKAEALRKIGADQVINYREQDLGEMLQAVGGVNLVLELVGTTLPASIQACAPDGRIILVGNLGGQQTEVDTQAWRLKRVRVIGGGGSIHATIENEHHILQMIAAKTIAPLIADTLPIAQAADAHRKLAASDLQGKIVMVHS
ncbi:NAD(P)H-quinone oxidoreductase [Ktedonosporobacter rubrisoli]|uniref:NAD(P)H-quinone oxidoreductase n=1 Tax=Ktedonosporobacter rubrisoli TaxID=2509675 RepID=A0A4V0YZ44_KTERU|nr:zinc-binding dehydrogenase [Ktedonosporobacter rubrisoli]QBD78431.1 NAD(P)H-quinone oxidoreductase [Ktedonosporobacter rubrisoli]